MASKVILEVRVLKDLWVNLVKLVLMALLVPLEKPVKWALPVKMAQWELEESKDLMVQLVPQVQPVPVVLLAGPVSKVAKVPVVTKAHLDLKVPLVLPVQLEVLVMPVNVVVLVDLVTLANKVFVVPQDLLVNGVTLVLPVPLVFLVPQVLTAHLDSLVQLVRMVNPAQ